jgi:hypothetical protein
MGSRLTQYSERRCLAMSFCQEETHEMRNTKPKEKQLQGLGPNKPFHLTAARLRIGTNPKRLVGAAAGDRAR